MFVLIHIAIIVVKSMNDIERLQLGYSSLSPHDRKIILVSHDDTFFVGFYNVGINAYCLAIWYSHMPNPKTVVWMANKDQPIINE